MHFAGCEIKSMRSIFKAEMLGSVYTGPVGTILYGTDRNCLEPFPLYCVYTGSVPKSSKGFLKS